MNKVLCIFLGVLAATALLFTGLAFVALDVDFRNWSEGMRVFYVVSLLVSYWLIFAMSIGLP